MSDDIDRQVREEAEAAAAERAADAARADEFETALEEALAARDDELPALTQRQCRFVMHYRGEARGNASEAARLAGYVGKRPDQSGRGMLEKPQVRAALRSEQLARVERLRLSADQIMLEAMSLARFDTGALVDPETGCALPAHLLPPEARRVVEGYKDKTQKIWGDGEQIGDERTIEYKQPSRIASYALAAKLAGFLIEQTKHSGEVVVDHAGDVRVIVIPAKAALPDDDGNHRELDS